MKYEIAPTNERVYFDTSMWVGLMFGEDPRNKKYEFVLDGFGGLRDNTFHVYVSDLVLMESVCVIRKRVIESETYDDDTEINQYELMSKAKSKVDYFYNELYNGQANGKITIMNSSGSLDDFLQKSRGLNDKHQNGSLFYRQSSKQYRYSGAGFLDIQHAIMATDFKCSRFYSTDHGFHSLKNEKEFKTLQFVIP